MQGPAWVALLRRISAELRDSLVVVTSNGAEIMVQALLRVERDFLVVRARMSGSQDTNRILFIPFDQIDHAGLAKVVPEAEVLAMLDKPGSAPAQVSGGETGLDSAGETGETTAADFEPLVQAKPAAAGPAEGAAAAAPQADPKAQPKSAHPSKSVLLARLRARLSEGPNRPGST